MKKLPIVCVTALTTLFSLPTISAQTMINEAGDSLTIDGRFEARYRDKGGDTPTTVDSGSSRLGFKGQKILSNDWVGFGHAEWGYNSGDNGDNIYDRLLYVGLKHDKYGNISLGTKQWSAFYDVAWFTDMGRVFGTRASGVYNLEDWGIASGTGRAENSLVYRNNIGESWHYGITLQASRHDVGLSGSENNRATATLENGLGGSLRYSGIENVSVGFAYQQNEISDLSLSVDGIENGDMMRVLLLGVNYEDAHWYLGATAHVGENWESVETSSSTNAMFDTRGGEVYGYYHFDNGLRPTLNYNYFESRDTDVDYTRHLLAPGLEYHFTRNTFLLWAEYQIDMGKDQLISDYKFDTADNQFAAGLRYYF
ncbi:putative porin [Vibrio crassostreae]|nr:putative porin [Vibrio crassostreae]CAK2344588.1 putative porin [Vibrio crassostreae]CAK2514289.1 putative porin [Vibrio crassostreae]CAK2933258.1 putative porin [Vibrio crassostreae]